MLVIRWSKQSNTSDILKNGIRPATRKKELAENISGVWCYPFTRNKVLNNNWKRNLKIWRDSVANFNGFVFRLEPSDFPILAGEFVRVGSFPDKSILNSYDQFKKVYGIYFSPSEMDRIIHAGDQNYLDYQDFEIIIPHRINADRIIRVIKDRTRKSQKEF